MKTADKYLHIGRDIRRVRAGYKHKKLACTRTHTHAPGQHTEQEDEKRKISDIIIIYFALLRAIPTFTLISNVNCTSPELHIFRHTNPAYIHFVQAQRFIVFSKRSMFPH